MLITINYNLTTTYVDYYLYISVFWNFLPLKIKKVQGLATIILFCKIIYLIKEIPQDKSLARH